MKKFYAVIGRIPGDDEDSCFTACLRVTFSYV